MTKVVGYALTEYTEDVWFLVCDPEDTELLEGAHVELDEVVEGAAELELVVVGLAPHEAGSMPWLLLLADVA